ncbi:hypothetical protein ACWJJH_10270 [Endozoicomonadaceae bacterium StTr2]
MITRSLLVLFYIWHCIWLRVRPWLFFQLNADYFNNAKGIFSKLDMDQRIPTRWRLNQFRDNGVQQPESFPVFIKPEWGQNSAGITRADNQIELDTARAARTEADLPYLVQESAPGKREFEVYLITSELTSDQFATLSITEVTNTSGEDLPVNGIYNKQTSYRDISAELSYGQMQQLWDHLKTVGYFRTARFGIRADSVQDLVAGEFKIFEINLFLPMPLVLHCENTTATQRLGMIYRLTYQLAAVTGTIPERKNRKSIFFRKLFGKKSTASTSSEIATHKEVIS